MGWWPQRLRQTHLGASLDKKLTIIDLRHGPWMLAPILQLPDEILSQIFSYLVTKENTWAEWMPCGLTRSARRNLTALRLCCRRFSRVSHGLLYDSLDLFLVPHRLHFLRSSRFYHSLEGHPECSKYCKDLYLRLPFHYGKFDPETIPKLSVAGSIVCSLLNVESLVIDGPLLDEKVWDLPSRISECMPRLRRITLRHAGGDLDVARIIEGFNFPMLKSLMVCDVRERHRRDPLKEIDKWPRALEQFYYEPKTEAYADPPKDFIKFESIHRILLPFKKSLRRIEINWLELSNGKTDVFYACTFPNLDYLRLIEENVCWEPEIAARALFGGSLRTLVLDCYLGHTYGWATLGPHRIRWWEQFLREVGKIPAPSSARREIRLENTGSTWYCLRFHEASNFMRTLLECLGDISKIAEEVGIDFSYKLGMEAY
ncbi:hypothetical protein AAE478_010405 [Parahypoxylon ruwenzoriense]